MRFSFGGIWVVIDMLYIVLFFFYVVRYCSFYVFDLEHTSIEIQLQHLFYASYLCDLLFDNANFVWNQSGQIASIKWNKSTRSLGILSLVFCISSSFIL